jgi:hypothetical protein
MEQVFNARDPNQVSSARVIEADLGVHNRRLFVISGIAIYNWHVDDDMGEHGEVRVNLGVYARELENAAPFVGLAAIGNGESEFVFSIHEARVDLDSESGELSLYAKTAVLGEWSEFYRFSYQVVATVVHVGTYVEGTITWPTEVMKPPSDDPSTVAPLLVVIANRHEMTSTAGPWGAYETLTPIVPGAIQSLTVHNDHCEAHYRIDNPPMGMPLKVTVTPQPGFTQASGGAATAERIRGPDVFTLSPFNTSETVDFAIKRFDVR